jgi:hypothetical protein
VCFQYLNENQKAVRDDRSIRPRRRDIGRTCRLPAASGFRACQASRVRQTLQLFLVAFHQSDFENQMTDFSTPESKKAAFWAAFGNA